MSERKRPLFEAMRTYDHLHTSRFHVPGHKGKAEAYEEAASYYGPILALDVTELPGTDDLHHPEAAILEAQRLAASCFGADETFFLVGGSTVGNQAAILAACRPGELLLVQRDAHKSVIHGLMLAGIKAVFITPRQDPASGLFTGLQRQDVEEALRRYPEAQGLLVTCPTYYGVGADLKPLADLLHAQDKLLLVDEAHGAHFGFHPELPLSALSAGADVVVQSTHKMLTAMTMGSMLHVQGDRINRKALRQALAMLQSSSPSYPIMGSLDLSRDWLQEQGFQAIDEGLKAINSLKLELQKNPRWRTVEPNGTSRRCDPFKMVLEDSYGILSGFELKEQLERRGCYAEMADPERVVLAFGLTGQHQEAQRLLGALKDIEAGLAASKGNGRAQPDIGRHQSESYDCPEASNSPHERQDLIGQPVSFTIESLHREEPDVSHVPLERCEGRIAAEMIVPYPPGIPLLYPGEYIGKRVSAELRRLAAAGARFQGYDVSGRKTVPVYVSSK
ncbi:aminotransferase class I/II-fold pyridoxal phosphate-dependent enzyme [Paenibacillus validus]|uniref:Aminotransferase class I/II-fold pyridoxal phosphate-dependent enzyme n=1 Tax=Paenibacillus validus TaxID=44253 RepID=A0A7X3CUC3_9BACL|nr:aminotransferase class I/II-fold pyridoxal phosphate-dependent enzyme [Paenibacillus validus]MUG73357.1 aminotransferase class I/II-fold pyridoxal phosphate-dependent enzyme [Paenibacillus validus]